MESFWTRIHAPQISNQIDAAALEDNLRVTEHVVSTLEAYSGSHHALAPLKIDVISLLMLSAETSITTSQPRRDGTPCQ